MELENLDRLCHLTQDCAIDSATVFDSAANIGEFQAVGLFRRDETCVHPRLCHQVVDRIFPGLNGIVYTFWSKPTESTGQTVSQYSDDILEVAIELYATRNSICLFKLALFA